MPLIQKKGGSVSINASIVTSLPAATTAGNSILIFANGAGTITTPLGFVSRNPQVNVAGVYLFEKLIASGDASDTPTLVMSGPYNATWQIAEYAGLTAYDTSAGNYLGTIAEGAVLTAQINPTTGNKRIVAFAVATMSAGGVPTAGDPTGWTAGFTGQQSNQVAGGGGAGQDPLAGGFADLLTAASGGLYSTSGSILNANGSTIIASAIIAAYSTTDTPPASTTPSPLYRSLANNAYGSRTNTTLTMPGVLNDSILLLGLFMGGGGAGPPTPTLPPGFSLIDLTNVVDGGGFQGYFRVAWKRAASESGSYTITHATASTQAVLLEYTGAIKTGSPIDAYSKATGNSVTETVPGITTTVDNTTLVWLSHDWDGTGTLIPPTNFIERFDSLVYAADREWPDAAATGPCAHNGAAVNPWSAFLLALKPAVAAGPVTGTGVLAAGASAGTGSGVSQSSGSASLTCPAASAAGAGTSRSLGTATLSNGRATVAGAGNSASTVTSAALLASLASVQGTEGVNDVSGTGDVPAQSSDLHGAGVATSKGTGALVAASRILAGAGRSGSSAVAPSLIPSASVISGAGVVLPATTGSGALVAQPARITATDYKAFGTGVLESGASTLVGVGGVPVWIIGPVPGGYPVRTAPWRGATATWHGATAAWINPGTGQWRNPGIAPPP